MGYNTCVVVLNDCLGDMERDPQFGAKLRRAIVKAGFKPEGMDGWGPANTKVLGCAHADHPTVYVIGGNTGRMITHDSTDEDLAPLIELLRWHGYDLKKTRKRLGKVTVEDDPAIEALKDISRRLSTWGSGTWVGDCKKIADAALATTEGAQDA